MDKDTKKVAGLAAIAGLVLWALSRGRKPVEPSEPWVPGPGVPEPVDLVSAEWDRAYYHIGDTATLTAQFYNPAGRDRHYTTWLRWTNPYTGKLDGIYKDVSIGAGQTIDVSYSFAVTETISNIMHIEIYHEGEPMGTIRVPDLTTTEATGMANILILGGHNNPRYWHKDMPTYTVAATIINAGEATGSQRVHGEWNVHHSQAKKREIDLGEVTLEPGEAQSLSFEITWDEMMQAHHEVGRWEPSIVLAGIGRWRGVVDRWYSEVIYFPE